MDNLVLNDKVYILLPDFSVYGGIINDICDGGLYSIKLFDGRTFLRDTKNIFFNELSAKARKFLCNYKFRLKVGAFDDLLDCEDKDVISCAVDSWPEEFI